MTTTTAYPRVRRVQPLSGKRLLIEFDNGAFKTYDCTPLLGEVAFHSLQDDALFRRVQADDHGYGVIWNDNIDLAESELWSNGEVTEPIDLTTFHSQKP
jgi:hypothetical protein